MPMEQLRRAVRGRVLLPGDDDFDQERRPWSLAVEQPVAAVVEAEDAADVAALVGYARGAGLAVAAQASGHGASGDVDGVILLRTTRLDEVRVHPEERFARVGAGVRWEQVQSVAGPHGLTGLTGSAPVVPVVGYTLGGGVSWFGRKHGFAADSVRAFEVVDAEGRPARVTAESDADLFWALRGGGGDFAVVTAMEFDLHPAPSVYGGRVVWSAERSAEVFDVFRDLTFEAPRELTVWINRLQLPGAPPMVVLQTTYLGQPDEGQALLRRIDKIGGAIDDQRGVVPVAKLGDITAEPTEPGPGVTRAELLTGLGEHAVETLLTSPIEPLVSVQIRHLGGAFAEDGGGACPPLTEPYALNLTGVALNPELAAAVYAQRSRMVQQLGGYVSGRKPYTSLAPGESAAAAFPEPVLERLRDLKRARDPQNVFRANYPVLGEPGRA